MAHTRAYDVKARHTPYYFFDLSVCFGERRQLTVRRYHTTLNCVGSIWEYGEKLMGSPTHTANRLTVNHPTGIMSDLFLQTHFRVIQLSAHSLVIIKNHLFR